jgi:hypothetical protein
LPTHSKSFRAEQRIDSLLDRTLPAWWVGDRLLVDVQSLCEALGLEYSVVPPGAGPEFAHAVGVRLFTTTWGQGPGA